MKNKKGFTGAMNLMISFAILSIMFIFATVLIFETGEDYVIKETADLGVSILNDTALTPDQGVNAVNNIRNKYSGFAYPYDLFFLLMWVSTFTFTIFSTFKSNKEGIFTFFGMLFMGSILMLLITSYLASFTDWFMTNIFNALFDDITISLPIFTFYLANLGLINFIWFLVLALVSVVDRTFISRTGEVQE